MRCRLLLLLPLATLVTVTLVTVTRSAGAVSSAELYRTIPHGYGKFEARLQFVGGDGVIGSYFLWKDGSEMADVFWNELDIEKVGADCELQTNSLFGLPEKVHVGKDYGLTGLCEGYHTYAYEWTPEYIAWFVDGVEIRRDIGADAAAYAENASEGMQVRFNLWPGDASFGGTFDPAILPVYEFVSWAQYSAYTPGTGDGGTNFTFTWREEFDTAPADWAMASWDSPKALSTHSPQNVVFVDGIAVLALTADDALGFASTPPPDGEAPSTGGSDGGALASGGSPADASGGATSMPMAPDEGSGCTYTTTHSRSLPVGASFGLLFTALVALRRRFSWRRVSAK